MPLGPKLDQKKLIALAREGAAKHGVPAAMVYAMMLKESSGRPGAVGDKGRALGLMQLHAPATEEMGYAHSEMLDPKKNVTAGSGYLAKMLRGHQGDPELALSAYNAGSSATKRAGGVVPGAAPYVEEVRRMVGEVTAEGQPFADEANVGSLPLPMQTMKKLTIQRYIEDLRDQDDDDDAPARPPLLAAGASTPFSEMLSLNTFMK